MTNVDLDPFRQFLALTKRKKELDALLKGVKAELNELAIELPKTLVDSGMASLQLEEDGRKFTMYVHTAKRASAKDQDALNKALCERGYGDLIQTKVNPQTLSALVNEFDKSDEGIPEWLDSQVDTYEDVKLRARKA